MGLTLEQEPRPFASLCVICGDEGAKSIGRMLKSVLDRFGGPLVEEVVIGWNGKDDKAFIDAMRVPLRCPESDFVLPRAEGQCVEFDRYNGVLVRVLRQTWRNNFAEARQQTYEAASGLWRGYLDCDDVLADPTLSAEDRAAVIACLRDAGADVAGLDELFSQGRNARGQLALKPLKDYIAGLRPETNVIVWPYDYDIGGDGLSLRRHQRPRFIRWADGWRWIPGHQVHEDVEPTGGNVRVFAVDAAYLVRHFPTQSADGRMARNRAIMDEMRRQVEQGERPDEPRIHYNIATFAIQDGDVSLAVKELTRALEVTADPADMLVFASLRCKGLLRLRNTEGAALDAMRIMGMFPSSSDGYFLMQEVACARSEWEASLQWHQLGRARKPERAAVDLPVEREAHTRVRAVSALLSLGRLDEAVAMATEALAAAPSDALARDALKLAQTRRRTEGTLHSALALAKVLLENNDVRRAWAAIDAVPAAFARDPRVRALSRVARARLDVAYGTRRGDPVTALPAPLPIFRAPSPWAREVGSLALRRGWRQVIVAGRPHPDDVAALRARASEVDWVSPAPARLDSKPDAVVRVDCAHLELYAGLTHLTTVDVIPAVGGVEPEQVTVIAPLDFAGNVTVRTCKLVENPRPDSDIPRLVVETNRSGGGLEHTKPEVVIVAPHWAEVWHPDAVKTTGCGGSEEAVIYLARELARAGVFVTVYGPYAPPGGYEVEDGVAWRPCSDFDPADVDEETPLILHRAPEFARHSALERHNLWIWHHDHGYPATDTWKIVAARTKHLFVSEWQRDLLAQQAGVASWEPGRAVVIGNGVPEDEFELEAEPPSRDSARVVYASQPQRGLQTLLRAWPYVLEAVPHASLDIFYGWQTTEFLARNGQPGLLEEIQHTNQLLETTPRVRMRGRVSQAQLAREMMLAGVWAYPCGRHFPFEVSCIAGLRAAAAGCVPVFSACGALPEVQPEQSYAVDPNLDAKAFAEVIVRAIRDEGFDRYGLRARALERHSWARVASALMSALDPPDAPASAERLREAVSARALADLSNPPPFNVASVTP